LFLFGILKSFVKTYSSMVKGIVFDLDGTLVDSLSSTFDAFNHGIMFVGGKKHTPQEIMRYFGTGEDKIFTKIVGPEKAQAAYHACKAYTDEHMHEIPLHPGVAELLEKVKSSDVPISIFTGRSWDTTHMILKHHRLMDRFITIVTNDHVNMPKPSPEGLYLALSRMRIDPKESLFVGDSPVDIMAGRSAGAQGVAALWDLLADKNALEACAPHHWASHPSDIWTVFQNHEGASS
jgi:HAD superfamily hydrolase (TIGR01509 family)